MLSMPKRTDLKRILLLGSGPIVIGQAAEFDYSGTQAVKALKEEGYAVVLVNSNPATIMTDPELADRTYIEPVTPDWVRKVIEREHPDALLPTMGGQTALNVAMALANDGTLERHGVELIGANARAIRMAEDRAEFSAAMRRIGLDTPVGHTVTSVAAALEAVAQVGYPAIIRPSFTLGGTGGGVAFNRAEFEEAVERALELSPVHSTLVKVPRFAFEKFPTADFRLTTQMKSVGETMAIGRTFKEAFQKGLRALEIGRPGWVAGATLADDRLTSDSPEDLRVALRTPTPERIFQVKHALIAGLSVDEIAKASGIDPWFLYQLEELVHAEREFAALGAPAKDDLRRMKRLGFSDKQLAAFRQTTEAAIREQRWSLGIHPAYKTVDTCAGEFPSSTPYLYSSYDEENESAPFGEQGIVILGSGPNRIGQGVEFDYCCVRSALAFRELGFKTIMINSNPETVSTDFDISDKLYFEPLTFEDVIEITRLERPKGVVVQLGGQTPLQLTKPLEAAGVPVLGTSPDAIDIAEDRERFEKLARRLGVAQPPNGIARSVEEAVGVAQRIGYPVLVRPSYVLGGRAMEIVYDDGSLRDYFVKAARVAPEHPVLIDRFLEDAFEADVDAIADGTRCVIGGVMQHIEDAGVHSGDSACVLPPYLIGDRQVEEMRRYTQAFARALGVVGLINVQYAIKDGVVYVLEVNPRASRTIPFVSKAIGVPLASLAARVMLGETLEDVGFREEIMPPYVSVKEAVFPFNKFPGTDTILGPEMRSTG